MKKAILIIAALFCLFVVIADMPGVSLISYALIKGVALVLMTFFCKKVERLIPNEEV